VASTVSSVIELLVGLACVGLGVIVWRRMAVPAAILWVAGLAAVVHALLDLV
jgi:hypothetical protein